MEIRTTYVGTLNGVHGMWCGFCPEGVEVEEERLVLYADPGYILRNKISEEEVTAVWIQSAEQQEDWEEIELPPEPEEEHEEPVAEE